MSQDLKNRSLATARPDLADQWHPEKNGDLTPHDVTPGMGKRVWWICESGHEWEATINHRSSGTGCPYCRGKKVGKANSLERLCPDLAKEWHPTKNEDLKPSDVTPGSNKNVQWKCRKGHTWQATVYNRVGNSSGCPYCCGKKGSNDYNLQVLHPDLATEWHSTKNGDLGPGQATPGSSRKVWWKCAQGHEWKAAIYSRVNGSGCPRCPRPRREVSAETSLQSLHPDLAEEWHPNKNGGLTPSDVTPGSGEKVWWLGKCGHEWQAAVYSRVVGNGCRRCHPKTSRQEIRLFCELKSIFRDALQTRIGGIECDVFIPKYRAAVEYDGVRYHKNKYKQEQDKNKERKLAEKGITLFRVREPGLDRLSDRDIIMPHVQLYISDVKNFLMRFQESIALEPDHQSMIRDYLTRDTFADEAGYNRMVSELPVPEIGTSLADRYPAIAEEWHFSKNGCRKPSQVIPGSAEKVWWLGKCGHEWTAAIRDRVKGTGCLKCSGHVASDEWNLQVLHPDLAKQWHPTRNRDTTPADVTPRSNQKVWWICEAGHEWKASPQNRTAKKPTGCPYCSGYRASDKNNLQSSSPDVAKQWHPTKNGEMKPSDVTHSSGKKMWWICEKGHEWEAVVANRAHGDGCPYCSGHKVGKDNNLGVRYPYLAREWHPTKNGDLTPFCVVPGNNQKVWWICAKGHEWEAAIAKRTMGRGCPYCSGKKACKDNSLQDFHPRLAREWHPTKNGDLKASDVTCGSGRKVWWLCENGHEWDAVISSRVRGNGCRRCSRSKRKDGDRGQSSPSVGIDEDA